MSGEAGGLIVIPLAFAGLPLVLGGLAIAGVAAIGIQAGSAAVRYEREKRRRRDAIRSNGMAETVGDFRSTINQTMQEQTALNVQASEQMMQELAASRAAMAQAAQQQDTQAFTEYVSQMKAYRTQTMQHITAAQTEMNQTYRQRITDSMAAVSQQINEQYGARIGELQQLQTDAAAKQKRAQELADGYIEEARTLLLSLTEDFDGQKFSPRQLAVLNEQFNQAVALYHNGRYESAIAGAKDVAIGTLEEIYEADAKKQEWENYFKLALVLSEEVKGYAASQAVVTQEAKEYAEAASGQKLEDEIVGIPIAEYTDRNAKGQTRFDYLTHKANEIYELMHSEQAEQLSTEQLQSCAAFLNGELYPAIAACINRAILNMNNAFSRQNISEEMIDFFEEHNFLFNGYAYEDDCHDKALHIGLTNEATGEELIITLAPELLEGGEIQTQVEIKQIEGDEANEERKAYYRQCVADIVKESNPYATVDLQCKAETRGKLSEDKEIKKKLKN